MKSPTPCRDEFKLALKRRRTVPLSHGLYKIKEGTQSLRSLCQTTSKIQNVIQNGGMFEWNEPIGNCMSYERAVYLKSIPCRVATTFGYTIYPGLVALEGDGVASEIVLDVVRHTNARIDQLLTRCDEVYIQLRQGINVEYAAMKKGNSLVLGLLDQSMSVVHSSRQRAGLMPASATRLI